MCYKVVFLSLALLVVHTTAQAAKSPQECPSNEMWKDCSSECEPSCKSPTPMCSSMCGEPKCQCQAGLVRDDSLQCVQQSECPDNESNPQKRQVNEQEQPQQCPDGEEYKTCSSACEPSCRDQSPMCIAMCGPAKCQCQSGNVRDDSSRCVPSTSCPDNGSKPLMKRQMDSHDPCATVRCSNGPCVVQNGSAVCTDSASVNTSHETDEANAKPCATYSCPDGQHCVPRQVQCFRAPCPPIPECVSDNA
ncbi:trypsin inhibitor like cysteine rich domain-containing protein [Ditylenchus destructor]|nr:trypsin inhibitor like cysteine rich domain-containing protein [Ditylenchus destructor]